MAETKVLAIIGSPRKNGNTGRMVEEIRKRLLTEDPGIGFETLFLADMSLSMCKGCFVCFSEGRENCPLKDDRDLIEEKMLLADAVIFAAPTYANGVPALMKNLIDRFAFACHRPFLFGRAVLCVATVGGIIGLKQTLSQLAMMAPGNRPVKLGISCPPIEMAGLKKRTDRKLGRAAKLFYRKISSRRQRSPGLLNLAYFSSFKAMSAFDTYRKACPADFDYYRDREYFYPLNGHPLSRMLGKAISGLMTISLGFVFKR